MLLRRAGLTASAGLSCFVYGARRSFSVCVAFYSSSVTVLCLVVCTFSCYLLLINVVQI